MGIQKSPLLKSDFCWLGTVNNVRTVIQRQEGYVYIPDLIKG
jgi:hypothetical protein